jgi:hypothetical protein
LERSQLGGANVQDAYLIQAQLRGSDRSEANLRGSDLSKAEGLTAYAKANTDRTYKAAAVPVSTASMRAFNISTYSIIKSAARSACRCHEWVSNQSLLAEHATRSVVGRGYRPERGCEARQARP